VQKQTFDSALEDDLSISPALAAVFEVMRVANISLEEGTISAEQAQSALEFLAAVNKVLGIMGADRAEERLPQEILDLVEKREQARQARNYKLADELRKKIESQGYLLEDTPQGARVKRG
jgi:cysteinyl-tRNA synthetase